MWKDGQQYSCGVVTPETKVVFRSPTAMVYLFIQMSAEMWHFDPYGDLYSDKEGHKQRAGRSVILQKRSRSLNQS